MNTPRCHLGCVAAIVLATTLMGTAPQSARAAQPPRAHVTANLDNGEQDVPVIELPDGTHRVLVIDTDGTEKQLTAEKFAARVYEQQTARPWWKTLLNITSPFGIAWVAFGLLGQVLFTGRMVVQWLVSERSKKSVVPVAFWWMSLGGATMLLAYFIWRKDIVGIIGQGTGWFIYIRNLYFIHNERRTSIADDPGPEPELADRRDDLDDLPQ